MRASGVLIPVSSIPSEYGIGCFSKEAYEIVDKLIAAGQKYWQILPLGPTGYGDSPYQSFSTFAGNPYFIDLEDFIKKGWLSEHECRSCDWGGSISYVDYGKMYENRYRLLRLAYERSNIKNDEDFIRFEHANGYWLDDYCLYTAIKSEQGGRGWMDWPEDLKKRMPNAVREARERLSDEIQFQRFMQYCFASQWTCLKTYANKNGIKIIGDVPIYVSMDSSDSWANPLLFQFDEDTKPMAVAGCPPDAFTDKGQLWGNPLYSWEYHRNTEFSWWVSRMKHSLELYDVIRIDHFRGFDEYYSVPYGDPTAEFGHWEKGPGLELFRVLKEKLPELDIIAEDLGLITDSVVKLVEDCGFPGMKVLQFAFDSSENSVYLPHKYDKNCVVYTGTHDNQTTRAWMEALYGHDKDFMLSYCDCANRPIEDCVWTLIRTAMSSTADLCVVPVWDYLTLGDEARMNFPGTLGNNWKWRLTRDQFGGGLIERIRNLTRIYGRL